MSETQLEDLLPDLEGLEEQATRELLERAHQINQLTQHPGWAVFCDYLIALTTPVQVAVLEGKVRSEEDYRERVGFIRGVRTAMLAPDRLAGQVQAMHEQALDDMEDVEF